MQPAPAHPNQPPQSQPRSGLTTGGLTSPSKFTKRLQPQPMSLAALAASAGQMAAAGTAPPASSASVATELFGSAVAGGSLYTAGYALPSAGTQAAAASQGGSQAGEAGAKAAKPEPGFSAADSSVGNLVRAVQESRGHVAPGGTPALVEQALEEVACTVHQYRVKLPSLKAYVLQKVSQSAGTCALLLLPPWMLKHLLPLTRRKSAGRPGGAC